MNSILVVGRCALPVILATLFGVADVTAQGRVWVVDANNGPGATHTAIQPAVDVAKSGDTILVRPGGYASFVVDGKALVISGESAKGVVTVGNVLIRRVGSAQSVTLQGVVAPTNRGLTVDACAGPILIDNCKLTGGGTKVGCSIQGSTAVTMVRCTVTSAETQNYPWYGTPACLVTNSNAYLFDCSFHGGGTSGYTSRSPAFNLKSGTLFAAGCRFTGNTGHPAWEIGAQCVRPPGNGTDAVWLGGPATLQDCAAKGGYAGWSRWCGPAQFNGKRIVLKPGGQLIKIAIPARRMTGTSPVREAQTATIDLNGQPGDVAILLMAPRQRPLSLPAFLGTILPDLSTAILVPVGSMPLGKLTLRVPIPDLGTGVDTQTLFLQAAILRSDESIVLGSPRAVVLLDRRF